MAYSLIAHTAKDSPDSNGVTTDPINTTGADLILIFVAANNYPTISDNQLNGYTGLTGGTINGTHGFWAYKQGPVTNASHTFSVDGTGNFPTIFVLAFSGSKASPFDAENGDAQAAVTSLATGSVTPAENNELMVAAIAAQNNQSGGMSIDSGFTETDEIDAAPNAWNGMAAYKIKTSAAAENPTFTLAASSDAVARIAGFKALTVDPRSDGLIIIRGA